MQITKAPSIWLLEIALGFVYPPNCSLDCNQSYLLKLLSDYVFSHLKAFASSRMLAWSINAKSSHRPFLVRGLLTSLACLSPLPHPFTFSAWATLSCGSPKHSWELGSEHMAFLPAHPSANSSSLAVTPQSRPLTLSGQISQSPGHPFLPLPFSEGITTTYWLGSVSKEPACNAADPGLIPGWGRSPGGGHGNPLQYSCLENPMDRGAWWATVHGIAKSRTWLSD